MTSPSGLAMDAAGNLFVAESDNRVRRISATGIATTVAGNGAGGFSGDSGPATTAQLQNPGGLAIDASGNLFIADTGNNRVRRVSPAGIIVTVAGTGAAGYSGDGGPAASARLSAPVGLALDASGNLLIADTGNHSVRKVSVDGMIATLAGNGVAGASGGLGPAVSAQLSSPTGLAFDSSGKLFIADSGNNRIRVVSMGTISTFAGNGTQGLSGDGGAALGAQFSAPRGIALDASGNLLIADTFNYRLRKVSAGVVTTAAGTGDGSFSGDNGPAVRAQLYSPVQVTADGSGNVFFADRNNNRVRRVSPDGAINTVAGSGGYGFAGDGGAAVGAQLAGPYGVAVDSSGNLYFSDQGNNRVRKVSANGTITTVAGNGSAGFAGDGGPAAGAQLNGPCKVAVDGSGNLFIADASTTASARSPRPASSPPWLATAQPAFQGMADPPPMPQSTSPWASRSTAPEIFTSRIRATCVSERFRLWGPLRPWRGAAWLVPSAMAGLQHLRNSPIRPMWRQTGPEPSSSWIPILSAYAEFPRPVLSPPWPATEIPDTWETRDRAPAPNWTIRTASPSTRRVICTWPTRATTQSEN
jgi:sugar lactone lactonase YvrE